MLLFIRLFAGITWLWSPSAQAVLSSEPLETVVSSRRSGGTDDPTASVSILTDEDLRQSQATTLGDALRTLPGLNVASTGAPGQVTSVFVRGSNSEHVLVLIDGVEANDVMSPSRRFDFAHIPLETIERIEVIRGPQSVLYGSDAIGGVIHIFTKRGRGPIRSFTELQGGSYETVQAAVGASGGSVTHHGTVAVSRLRTRGFSAASEATGNSEADGLTRTAGTARIGGRIGKIDIDLISHLIVAETDLDAHGGYGGDDPNYRSHGLQTLHRLLLRRFFSQPDIESLFAVSVSHQKRRDHNQPDPIRPNDSQDRFEGTNVRLEQQNNWKIKSGQKLSIGIETEIEAGSTRSEIDTATVTRLESLSTSTSGLFAQYQLESENWLATTGLRTEVHREYGAHTVYRAGLGYRLLPTITLRTAAGTGFKAPSLYQLNSPFGDPGLNPETSMGFEAGLAQSFESLGMHWGATVFGNRFANLIDYDTALNRYQNRGRAESYGVELEWQTRVTTRWTFSAQHTELRTRDLATGQPLLRRPRRHSTLRATWTATANIETGLEWLHIGRREDLEPAVFPPTRTRLSPSDRLNLTARWRADDQWSFFGRVENIGNDPTEAVAGYTQPGRSFYGGARSEF